MVIGNSPTNYFQVRFIEFLQKKFASLELLFLIKRKETILRLLWGGIGSVVVLDLFTSRII